MPSPGSCEGIALPFSILIWVEVTTSSLGFEVGLQDFGRQDLCHGRFLLQKSACRPSTIGTDIPIWTAHTPASWGNLAAQIAMIPKAIAALITKLISSRLWRTAAATPAEATCPEVSATTASSVRRTLSLFAL
jgi:hypothetical protein